MMEAPAVRPGALMGLFWAAAFGLALALGMAHDAGARAAPESFADLSQEVSPAVVNITTTTTVAAPVDGQPVVPEGSPFEVVLTVFCRDMARIVRDPQHAAGMVGTVDAPALSSSPLTISEGRFNLFVENPGADETRNLRYRMRMHSREGKTYYFDGIKVVHDDPGFDLWHDMTTLFSTVYDGEGPEAPVLGKGIIHVQLGDFIKQLATMHATGTQLTAGEQAEALAQFGKFFGYALISTYGKGLVD